MADAKQGKTPDDFYNGSSQSRIILAKPRLGGFGSSNFPSTSNKSFSPFGSVLRPPQLKPGSNPFLKVDPDVTSAEKDTEKEKEKPAEENVEERLKENKEDIEVPKFVPLGSSNTAPRNSSSIPAAVQPTTSSSASGFVFGQNLSDRVVIQENIKNGEATDDHGSVNGSSELLFTSAAASVRDGGQEEAGPSDTASSGEGLAAAAAEYERSHARPPPPAASCTVTGEEDETNVLQISCRLFAWESGQWRERGRGVLRLNDSAGGGGARLVARSAGALRVVLNTKLWPDMVADRAGPKSLRLTAADAEQRVKLFLVMGAPGDIAQLHRALVTRIAVSKTQRSTEKLDSSAIKDYNQEGDADIEDKHDEDLSDTQEGNDMADDRLERDTNEKTDDDSQTNITEETKGVKRKEPIDDETLPKRQCPDTN